MRCIAHDGDQFRDDAGTDDIQCCVDPFRRKLPDAVCEIRSVGRRDGAQFTQVIMFLRACRADHGDAPDARKLEDGRADAAGGTADEQRLAGFDANFVEAAPGRFRDDGQAAGDLEGQVVGFVDPMGEDGMFCHRAPAITEDGVADKGAGDAGADPIDNAGGLDADACGKTHLLKSAISAFAALPVRRVDAGGAHRDAHLAGAGMWRVNLKDFEDLGAAVAAELNGFHGFSVADAGKVRPIAVSGAAARSRVKMASCVLHIKMY